MVSRGRKDVVLCCWVAENDDVGASERARILVLCLIVM